MFSSISLFLFMYVFSFLCCFFISMSSPSYVLTLTYFSHVCLLFFSLLFIILFHLNALLLLLTFTHKSRPILFLENTHDYKTVDQLLKIIPHAHTCLKNIIAHHYNPKETTYNLIFFIFLLRKLPITTSLNKTKKTS